MKTYVIAYGGSIVIPGDTYDQNAIIRLASIIREHDDVRFIFIIGGGKLCCNITTASKDILATALPEDDIGPANDELGIAATKINSRTVIKRLTELLGEETVYQDYIDDPKTLPDTDKRVIIASGYRPGVTTDYCMVKIAEISQASKAFKISNFPQVLDVEPTAFDKNKIDSYEKLEDTTWKYISDLVGTIFIPGGNYPMDPSAAQLGNKISETNENGFTMYIGMNTELENMLRGEHFTGTTITKG